MMLCCNSFAAIITVCGTEDALGRAIEVAATSVPCKSYCKSSGECWYTEFEEVQAAWHAYTATATSWRLLHVSKRLTEGVCPGSGKVPHPLYTNFSRKKRRMTWSSSSPPSLPFNVIAEPSTSPP